MFATSSPPRTEATRTGWRDAKRSSRRLGQPASGSWASKLVRMIGTRSAGYIRASGYGAAQTGRTHDLHPTAGRTSDSSCNAGVVHTWPECMVRPCEAGGFDETVASGLASMYPAF